MVTRTLRFPAKLSTSKHCALNVFLTAQRHLWNAALEERIGAYRKLGKSLSAYDQFKSLTQVRADDPDYAAVSVIAHRSILFRLDKAFKAFFSRVKRGEKPGFPRFRFKGGGGRAAQAVAGGTHAAAGGAQGSSRHR